MAFAGLSMVIQREWRFAGIFCSEKALGFTGDEDGDLCVGDLVLTGRSGHDSAPIAEPAQHEPRLVVSSGKQT